MTAKEYLQQSFYLHRRIEMLKDARDTIKADLYSTHSPQLNPDKVQTSVEGDRMERLIAKADEMTRDIVRELERLTELRDTIRKQIDQMPHRRNTDILQREVLYRRYVLFERWEKIAVDMDKTTRYIFILHGNALRSFGRLYGNATF